MVNFSATIITTKSPLIDTRSTNIHDHCVKDFEYQQEMVTRLPPSPIYWSAKIVPSLLLFLHYVVFPFLLFRFQGRFVEEVSIPVVGPKLFRPLIDVTFRLLDVQAPILRCLDPNIHFHYNYIITEHNLQIIFKKSNLHLMHILLFFLIRPT